MHPIISLILAVSGPMSPVECSFVPEPCQKPAGRTSTQKLLMSPQGRPPISDDEKEKNRVRLGITQQQQQQIDDLYNETRTKMSDVWKSMGEKQRQLRDVYREYAFDEAKAKSLRIDINRLHRKMTDIQLENERKIRMILTREQFDKLQLLMKEKFEQFRRNRPGPPPPDGKL